MVLLACLPATAYHIGQNEWNKVSLFIYHFAWTVVVILLLPFLPLMRKGRILERLGWRLPSRLFSDKTAWVHALSVGEVVSSLPLIEALKQAYPSKKIVLTVTTPQGMNIAQKKLRGKVDAILPMPLDFWWSMGRMVRCIDPDIFLLVETDLWPGLIYRLKKKGVPALLLNGRISPRTFRAYRRFPGLVRSMLNTLNECLMQSDLDRERLLRIGVERGRVKTVGNIKFDRDWVPMDKEEQKDWMQALYLVPEDPIWVAGSTHGGEEEIILDVFEKLRPLFPGLRLILAPRRVERATEIHRLCSQKGFKSALRKGLTNEGEPYDVLVLDTMGELGRIYGIGALSFVGGSLVPIGGHNPLEPASFGHPVLFGPYTHNFVLMSQLLIEAGGGKRVKSGDDLFEQVKGLLSSSEDSENMGRRAKAFVDLNRGALERVMEHINTYMKSKDRVKPS